MERKLEQIFEAKLDQFKNELKADIIKKFVEMGFFYPTNIRISAEGIDLDKHMNMVEKTLLLKALERSEGDKTEAARLLKMPVRSLRYRMDKHGIEYDILS